MIRSTTRGRVESVRYSAPSGWRELIRQNTNRMLVTAAFAVGLTGYLGYLTGDNLYVNGIPPWDASAYTNLARHFYTGVTQVGPYTIQRILPSAIIYHVFRLFHIPPTDSNIIHAFIILDGLLITLIGYLFCLIADRLEISNRGKWLGFVGLFFNFAVLKHRLYDPILTDTSAYAVGMLMLYFYLTRNRIGLYVSTMLGAFVWPTILLQGVFLLIFFRREAPGDAVSAEPAYLKKAAVIVSLLIGSFALLFILYLRHSGFAVVLPLFGPAFYLSVAVVVLYLFWGMKTLLSTGELLQINNMFSYLANWRFALRLVPVALLIGLIKISQHLVASAQGFDYPVKSYLSVTFWVSILYPGVFFISHVIYFGPIVILLLFLWPEVCRLIHQQGAGLSLWAISCFVLSLNSESRDMINFMPLFVVFLVKATDSLRWGSKQYWLLAIISILMSKVWLTIGPMKTQGMNIASILLSNQRLFMNNGPAMSGQMYLLQSCVVLLAGFIIYYFCIRNRSAVEIRRPA